MGSKFKDLEGSVRKGEELNLDALLPWLNRHINNLDGHPKVTQFSGGASNWTYRLEFDNKEIILRRAPTGAKASGAHDMAREFHLQSKLKPHYPYVPKMLALCEDSSILGSVFYVMEKLEGIIPRKNFPHEVDWSEQTVNSICQSFLDKLIELHKVDYKANDLESVGKGSGYIERQIIGWNKRYSNAKTWNVPSGKKVMRWLENNMPANEQLCVIHNDFRLDNVVLEPENPSNILGVLDWELATIGDPLMDLGNSLAYWVQEDDDFFVKSLRRQPTDTPGMMTRKEIVSYYEKKSGIEIPDFRFYRVYGLFRLAGIVQQIYFRYSKGYTKNKAFKNFWLASNYFIRTCQNVIRKG